MLLLKNAMRFFFPFLFASIFLGFANKSKSAEEMNTRKLVNQLLESIENVKTLKYNLQLSERINGKMLHTSSSVKLQVSPRKLYLYLKGPELLWVQGQNNGNALVNPGAFPYFNLNLNPMGAFMRKDQHHTINEMGYEYFAGVLRHMAEKSGEKFDKYFVYTGEETWNNRQCYKLVISYPDFSFSTYKVQNKENLIIIARKLFVSEYMLLENNPQISDYYSVKAGQEIKVPNAYARTTILLIDKQYLLPINNKIYDDKGLFESYEYHNLIPNPKFSDEEFTKDYKDYHF